MADAGSSGGCAGAALDCAGAGPTAIILTAGLTGFIPDLLKGWFGSTQPMLVSIFLALAVIIYAFSWLDGRLSKDRGVGIVVNLPVDGDPMREGSGWEAKAAQHARKTHDSAFVVRQAIRRTAAERQADLGVAKRLVDARWREETERGRAEGPVAVYVQGTVHDLYLLGAEFKANAAQDLSLRWSPQAAGDEFVDVLSGGTRLRVPGPVVARDG